MLLLVSITSLNLQKTRFETLHMTVNYRLGEISSQNQKLEIELKYDDPADEPSLVY